MIFFGILKIRKNFTGTHMSFYARHNKRTFVIEGNIGAGKSTFLSLVEKYLLVDPIFEPHDQWQTVGNGENLLEKFYTDTQRWAYTFQTYAFVTRVLAQEERFVKSSHNEFVLERSVFSDRYCFAKNCYEMGIMSALEWQLYQDWFSWLVDRYTVRPSGFIYLQTDPVICHERMAIRSRQEESTVSLDYLQRLHEKHEDWLIRKNGIPATLAEVPVLVLDCNKDFEHDETEQLKHMTAISEFFGFPFKQQSSKQDALNLVL